MAWYRRPGTNAEGKGRHNWGQWIRDTSPLFRGLEPVNMLRKIIFYHSAASSPCLCMRHQARFAWIHQFFSLPSTLLGWGYNDNAYPRGSSTPLPYTHNSSFHVIFLAGHKSTIFCLSCNNSSLPQYEPPFFFPIPCHQVPITRWQLARTKQPHTHALVSLKAPPQRCSG